MKPELAEIFLRIKYKHFVTLFQFRNIPIYDREVPGSRAIYIQLIYRLRKIVSCGEKYIYFHIFSQAYEGKEYT